MTTLELLQGLRLQIRDAKALNKRVVRIELTPKAWDAVRRDIDLGPVSIVEAPPRPQLLGYPVRVWEGIRNPRVIST